MKPSVMIVIALCSHCWIAFSNAELLGAELGSLSGHAALVAMLDWGDGRFQFEATVDEQLIAKATPRLLDGAIFEAVRELDERGRAIDDDQCDEVSSIEASTTYLVDFEQEENSRSSLDKTEEAVLELAKSGMTTEKLKVIIPESADDVQESLESLVELGVLIPQ